MLSAKQTGKQVLPVLAHAGVHGLLMLIFLFCFIPIDTLLILKLIGFQVVTHFLIDISKGRMNGWFPILIDPSNKWFWLLFGFDQFLHALVIIGMSYYAVAQLF